MDNLMDYERGAKAQMAIGQYTPPSLLEGLKRNKAQLESKLAEVNAAITSLEAAPEAAALLESLRKVGGLFSARSARGASGRPATPSPPHPPERKSMKVQGIGFGGILFLVFLVLKLTNHINWSWWWVTCPLWGGLVVLVAFLAILGIVGLTVAVFHK